jgi:hypothetical protein
VLGVILVCVFGVLIVCAALRYQLQSTSTHLIIGRRRRPTTDRAIRAHHMDVREVRRMEWELYGHYLTGLDGRPLDEDDPAAHVHEDVPMLRPDIDSVKPEGNPCWCNYCKGRVGAHGADAVALYQAQAKAAVARATPSQRITNTMVGGSVTQISAGRNIVISGDASGVIVTGDGVVVHQRPIGDLTPQDISGMTMAEFAALRRRMGMDTPGRKGMFG